MVFIYSIKNNLLIMAQHRPSAHMVFNHHFETVAGLEPQKMAGNVWSHGGFEILHQLIDGLSVYPIIHWVSNHPRWCRISSIHSRSQY